MKRERTTYRTCGMCWRFTGHQIEYLLFDDICGTNTRLQFILFLLRLLFAPFHCTLVLWDYTFRSHANGQTFFQAALLTFASHVHVHFTGMAEFTAIDCIFGNTPPEEALTTLTGEGIVVITRCPVTTDQAQFFLQTGRRTFFDFLDITSITRGEAIETT